MTHKDEKKVAAAKARSEKLTPERRSEIAQKAAEFRWSANLPQAAYEGSFFLGDKEVACAVLEDETRVITQGTFLKALGRSRSPKAGTGVLSTVDELPTFLSASALKPYINNDLMTSTKPVFYRTLPGGKGVGYNAIALKQVADVYRAYHLDCLRKTGRVPKRYERMVDAAELINNGLAEVGIVGLIDEATGYQNVRQRHALQEILDAYLRRELAAWAKRFPDEFYREIYRLRGWEWSGRKKNPPQVVAKYTVDFVYDRLAPGITQELQERMPVTESGNRKGKLHQLFTDDVGHPALAQHLYAVIALMRASTSWGQFKLMLDSAFPKCGTTFQLPFNDVDQRA